VAGSGANGVAGQACPSRATWAAFKMALAIVKRVEAVGGGSWKGGVMQEVVPHLGRASLLGRRSRPRRCARHSRLEVRSLGASHEPTR